MFPLVFGLLGHHLAAPASKNGVVPFFLRRKKGHGRVYAPYVEHMPPDVTAGIFG
jgi:hypothetical protein